MNRRDFFKVAGLVGVMGALPGKAQVQAGRGGFAPPPLAQAPAKALAQTPQAYTYFTPAEAAFVEAAVARLIPADELGPGGLEAGCAYYIDQQLSGSYGNAGRWYMQGPFGESAPEQGYQLPLTPRQLYRLGIEKVNAYCQAQYGNPFDQLSTQQQDEVLAAMDGGKLPVADAPISEFFNLLLGNAIEGFFADPIYGGNRDKVGWKLVGFPGVAAAYVGVVGNYGQPYQVEPVGIADVMQGRAQLDEHGHPIHTPLAKHQP
ncbi:MULTISPECIES: gluconate 2-dehydrogenase subunit 3 family protein [unclassified Meiothermus]|uniref:gluconate 2-dehydrogenase subunit 3 family protein n=1 Tax=unclassified Meiothermus TaxID=370471 RepID=UPI000D7C7C18|nr:MULTISPECIES: gluconate 2-dehydrogenase subunit 3 family protein [unclassified Meiothermus]PZA08067.1 gluconate 2-dehydrogenase subunit 3 family protein [Meiothermus sp. Pnk-1]RYM37498.1 gluconate 2-dehydrogenase subunit 3 family protein [Meiothermus sp. PNK-Is4]